MPYVNSFLGLELATGARAAAVYTLLLSFPLAAEGYLYLQSSVDVSDDEEKFLQRYKNEERYGVSQIYDSYRKASTQTGASYLACATLLFIASICLLVGVSKENPKFTWPWLVTDGLATGYFLYRYIYHGFVKRNLYIEETIIGLILIFIASYFFLIVHSYRQLLIAAASIQEALSQTSTVMQPQLYGGELNTDTKDLPPPYSAYALYPPPPLYSETPMLHNEESTSQSQQSSNVKND